MPGLVRDQAGHGARSSRERPVGFQDPTGEQALFRSPPERLESLLMTFTVPGRTVRSPRLLSGLLLASAFASGAPAFAGTWTPLAHPAPGGVNLMLQLADGTVMCANNDGSSIGNAWYRLTPDAHGSYVNGTWTVLASAHDTRLYYPSQVLRDGRVIVAGGEYGTGGPKCEIYDPLTNVWTQNNPPSGLWNQANDNFYDCNSEILPDGKVLFMPVFPHVSAVGLRYDPATNAWSNAGPLAHGTYQDEASWVKLTDDSVLTIDPFGTQSERYFPATNTWIADSNVPTNLYDPFGFELGGALLLPNGNAFFLGSTGHTALYTPTGTTSPGTWVAGPNIPGNHGTPDAPAAMMVDGKILCAVSPIPTSGNHFPSPVTFYEYDWVTNSFASVTAPTGASEPGASYEEIMLDLPDGRVLWSHFGPQLYVYTPSGAPLAAGKPAISTITPNGDGSYHLVGTGLNGISEGASYGDDFQMNSNYPLVRLSDGAGNVTYARTYNWSSTGVRTGATPVSTEFRVPASLPPGSYSLVVVANGIASDAVPFNLTAMFTNNCFGDGSLLLCPCLNIGAPGHGCDNSGATGGGLLSGSGVASLASDTAHLNASGELPTAFSILLQGTVAIPQTNFGDGVRCAGGNLKRLFSLNAVGGALSLPPVGGPSISAQSAALGDPITNGQSRIYQVYYRDPNLVFCPGGFNVTNAVTVNWGS